MQIVKKLFELFNVSGGAILGAFTLTMVGLSIAAFVLNRGIPASVVTVYSGILAAFAITKTYKFKIEKGK